MDGLKIFYTFFSNSVFCISFAQEIFSLPLSIAKCRKFLVPTKCQTQCWKKCDRLGLSTSLNAGFKPDFINLVLRIGKYKISGHPIYTGDLNIIR